MQTWIRTCQECNNKQADIPPPENPAAFDRWAQRKCKKCKSEALNYGNQLAKPASQTTDDE